MKVHIGMCACIAISAIANVALATMTDDPLASLGHIVIGFGLGIGIGLGLAEIADDRRHAQMIADAEKIVSGEAIDRELRKQMLRDLSQRISRN